MLLSRFFDTPTYTGIVLNTMVRNGQLIELSDSELVNLLQKHYGESVELAPEETIQNGLYLGDHWESILANPTPEDSWWEGRLSLEESLQEPNEDGDYEQSGRQPRVL